MCDGCAFHFVKKLFFLAFIIIIIIVFFSFQTIQGSKIPFFFLSDNDDDFIHLIITVDAVFDVIVVAWPEKVGVCAFVCMCVCVCINHFYYQSDVMFYCCLRMVMTKFLIEFHVFQKIMKIVATRKKDLQGPLVIKMTGFSCFLLNYMVTFLMAIISDIHIAL